MWLKYNIYHSPSADAFWDIKYLSEKWETNPSWSHFLMPLMWEDSEFLCLFTIFECTISCWVAFSHDSPAHLFVLTLIRRASALMISFPSGKAHMMSYWQSIYTFLSAAYTIKYSHKSDVPNVTHELNGHRWTSLCWVFIQPNVLISVGL